VAASEAQNSMQTATAVENTESAQFVGGKTFVQQGWVSGPDGTSLPFWVDTAYKQQMSLMWVEFAGDEYFMLAQEPKMAEWLAVGQEMVIVVSETQAIRVTTNAEEMMRAGNAPLSPLPVPAEGSEPAPSAPGETGDAPSANEEEAQNAWDAFWDWLWGN
jgi:hypothetical protein